MIKPFFNIHTFLVLCIKQNVFKLVNTNTMTLLRVYKHIVLGTQKSIYAENTFPLLALLASCRSKSSLKTRKRNEENHRN